MYRTLRPAATTKTAPPDALAVALFGKPARLPAEYATLDRRCGGALGRAVKRAEFVADAGHVTTIYPDTGPGRVYLLSLGDREKFAGQVLRNAAAKLLRIAWEGKVRSIGLELTPGLGDAIDAQPAGRAVGDGMAAANFEFIKFKSNQNDKRQSSAIPATLQLHASATFRKGLSWGIAVGRSTNIARDLAASPPNVANPAYLVRYCRTMARQIGLRCRIVNAAQAKKLKMGGLLAVGAAGSTPPALICLEHRPRAAASKPPILLVGKAVTFDTGGYSIKPGASMMGMKYDKSGGTAVIGAMHAIATLKLPVHVVGLIPTAENMVDRTAYRPNDIVRMYNGVTVEITNTDAEGRLILADALAYGCKIYKPKSIIDLATLTGAVVITLGHEAAGLFCKNAALRKKLLDAAEDTGQQLWHLPMWDEYKPLLDSPHADLVNSGPRLASSIQGAVFLSHFVQQNKQGQPAWAHLDIAGVSDTDNDSAMFNKGPTGYGVRLIVRALEGL